jgi:DNA-binding GntR family transcriptional regulator
MDGVSSRTGSIVSLRPKSKRGKVDVDPRDDQSKSLRVYADLRRRIRELELEPGVQLDKNQIGIEYGVSRAPVSEAIARLAAEGLVDVFPQSGSFVAEIRLEDVRENLLVRTGLEIEIARRAAVLASDSLLDSLEENLDAQASAAKRGDLAKLDELDAAFHSLLVGAVNSPSAARLIDRTRAILDRPRFHTLPEKGRVTDTVSEHRGIVDAIRTRDPEFAGAAMRVHLVMVAQAIERNIAQVQESSHKPKSKSKQALASD